MTWSGLRRSTNGVRDPFQAGDVEAVQLRKGPGLMLTQGEDVEVQALRKRGWSYVAIGRHIGHDWRTVKAYVEGREPGQRRRAEPNPLDPLVPYLKARFVDDPHVWASALFDEVVELGYGRSYPSFVRQLRAAGLRPHCEACDGVHGRDTIDIDHPGGEELLCGKPHRNSYVELANMRRRAAGGRVQAGLRCVGR